MYHLNISIMFNQPVINLILLLSFVYFISSLMVSSINEVIVAGLSLRRKMLKEAISKLFGNSTAWKEFLSQKFYTSPYITSLKRNDQREPAYIPARNFAQAVIAECGFDAATIKSPETAMKDLQTAITSSTLPDELKKVLNELLLQTEGKLTLLQQQLETFYNEAMDRIGDWYKAQIRWIIFILSVILCTALNIDTIKIARNALQDKEQLSRIADRITAAQGQMIHTASGVYAVIQGSDTVWIPANTQVVNGPSADSAALQQLLSEEKELAQLRLLITDTGIPLGYKNGWQGFVSEWSGTTGFLTKALGILLTCFALLMGSNYWFDMMNKVVNIRAAGKKPDTETKSGNQ